MSDLPIIVVCISIVLLAFLINNLGQRFLDAWLMAEDQKSKRCERWLELAKVALDAWEKQSAKATASVGAPFGIAQSTGWKPSVTKVEDLDPEKIAPSLAKPPRPAGGFGTRASGTERDTQLQTSGDDTETRTEDTENQATDEQAGSCETGEDRTRR